MKLIERYSQAKKDFDELEIKKVHHLKSYLTGIFFSSLIFSIYVAFIINLMVFRWWANFLSFALILVLGGIIYVCLLFKDMALRIYDERTKDVDLLILRIFDFLIIYLMILVVYGIFMIFFRWW